MIQISDACVTEAIETKFMGDTDLFLETAKVFLDAQERTLERLLGALSEGRVDRAAELIHSFKSSLAYFHRREPVSTAQEMERYARSGAGDKLVELAPRLTQQVASLTEELRQLVAAK